MADSLNLVSDVDLGNSLTSDVGSAAVVTSDIIQSTIVTSDVAATGPVGPAGTDGIDGIDGVDGQDGADGVGVPTGGTTGQYLNKASNTNYDTQWSTLSKSSVGLSNVDNTSDASKPVSTATQTAIDAKVDKNSTITGATKTKITYDAKGLVTAGADATQDDIGDGTTYKQYSQTEKTKLAGIASGATANSTDATLLARANHTGTQSADTITDGTTNKAYTATEKTKLAGIEALADVTDATNVDAAGAVMNSDTSTAAMSFVVDEDNMASDSATKVPTQQSVKAYVDTSIVAGGSYTDEQAQDAVGGMVADTSTIDFTYTDATPELKADVKDGSITYAKIQDVSATDKVLGRVSVGAGDVEEISTTGSGNVVRATSPTLVTPALGTPSALTLTNATGLPVSGITASTATALGVGSIELGHATDTTLSRSAAGVLAVEGVVVPTISSTSTLTNKTLTTPTIGDFTNAQHNHSNAAGGGLLTHTGLPAGSIVQVATTTSSAVATGTTIIPQDDTIPQNTEGDQYMTLAITPLSTTNRLVIIANVMLSNSVAGGLIAALFQDTTVNALAAADCFQGTATGMTQVVLTHEMAAGTTSSTTFKIRGGGSAAGTTTFNGAGAARRFGGVAKSSIIIYEVKA